jgi:hypothetical protein
MFLFFNKIKICLNIYYNNIKMSLDIQNEVFNLFLKYFGKEVENKLNELYSPFKKDKRANIVDEIIIPINKFYSLGIIKNYEDLQDKELGLKIIRYRKISEIEEEKDKEFTDEEILKEINSKNLDKIELSEFSKNLNLIPKAIENILSNFEKNNIIEEYKNAIILNDCKYIFGNGKKCVRKTISDKCTICKDRCDRFEKALNDIKL